MRQIEPCLYPRAESLLPYYLAILIHAAGNPDPIAELERDCLQSLPLLDDRQTLVWFKPRANSVQRRTHWCRISFNDVIRKVIKNAGFRWKMARVVLTSNAPEYREKLDHVHEVLSNLKETERFFSVDEYGPFAVKIQGGRILVPPGTNPTIPQWQKSKGSIIMTAALELSRNQITHFYSSAKNTAEMIRMAKILSQEYQGTTKIYLSWDAASWHMSKKLLEFMAVSNTKRNTGLINSVGRML